jgi:adenylate kinase family enzyme
MKKHPRKIAIIGLPGSGKSTFAIRLGKLLHIPVHHLGKHMFDGRKKRDRQEFLQIKDNLIHENSWIIEGCSFSTFEMRFANADTVIYFHLPRLVCIWRVFKRSFKTRNNDETGCLDSMNWPLIKYIWNFDREKRPTIEALRKKYPDLEFTVFNYAEDSEKFLKQFLE